MSQIDTKKRKLMAWTEMVYLGQKILAEILCQKFCPFEHQQ